MTVAVADLVLDDIPTSLSSRQPDLGSLIFVLCAIAPEHHIHVMIKVFNYLKPGAILYFRDYA
jgi:methyltransferase-like protein 6